jgi:hypothetical protein
MFRFKHMTLTQIGELFGVTSHQVGKWLVEIGLRTPGKRPNREAFAGGYVKQGPSRNQGYNWCWESVKTVKALEIAGHRQIPNPPPGLVDPPMLNGPFQVRPNTSNSFDIVNGDGSVAVVVTGEQNAGFLVKVLNLADRGGVIARHMNQPNLGRNTA